MRARYKCTTVNFSLCRGLRVYCRPNPKSSPWLLNIAATGDGQTTSTGTDTGWITGELKKDEQTERIVSCLDSAKTQDCSKGVFTGTEKRTETAEIWKE